MDRLNYLLKYLLSERPEYGGTELPEGFAERFALYRSLVNIRAPEPISEDYLAAEEEFLRAVTAEKGIEDFRDLTPVKPRVYLRRGDITTLKCGAIVNAANSAMMGCFRPCHGCVDNAIHTFAGTRLRLECADVMRRQGHEEPVGGAKVTRAYALPCERVIHTVGPYVSGGLTERHRAELRSCYLSCLEAAKRSGLKSVAFCCISTGEFRFPNRAAAETAVRAVSDFLRGGGDMEVIFNVFKDEDFRIYDGLLGGN